MAMGPNNEPPPYNMDDYLKALSTRDPNEIIVITLRELNSIKDQLINEETRPQIFIVGTKSLALYDPIKNDLLNEGFKIGFLDLYNGLESFVTYEQDMKFVGDYILLTDSIRTGKEICDLIKKRSGKIIRIYSNFATEKGKKIIMKEFGLSEDVFKISMGISEDATYRDKLLRNKAFGVINSEDIGFETEIYSDSFYTNLTNIQFIDLLEISIQKIMNCNKIKLDKLDLFNLMLPTNIHNYVHCCICDIRSCRKWFNNPTTGELLFNITNLFIWVNVEKQDTLYKVKIAFDDFYGNKFPTKNLKEKCNIAIVYKCTIKKSSKIKKIRMINKNSHCRHCVNKNIYNRIAQEIYKEIIRRLNPI
jgi:hypothetical protein